MTNFVYVLNDAGVAGGAMTDLYRFQWYQIVISCFLFGALLFRCHGQLFAWVVVLGGSLCLSSSPAFAGTNGSPDTWSWTWTGYGNYAGQSGTITYQGDGSQQGQYKYRATGATPGFVIARQSDGSWYMDTAGSYDAVTANGSASAIRTGATVLAIPGQWWVPGWNYKQMEVGEVPPSCVQNYWIYFPDGSAEVWNECDPDPWPDGRYTKYCPPDQPCGYLYEPGFTNDPPDFLPDQTPYSFTNVTWDPYPIPPPDPLPAPPAITNPPTADSAWLQAIADAIYAQGQANAEAEASSLSAVKDSQQAGDLATLGALQAINDNITASRQAETEGRLASDAAMSNVVASGFAAQRAADLGASNAIAGFTATSTGQSAAVMGTYSNGDFDANFSTNVIVSYTGVVGGVWMPTEAVGAEMQTLTNKLGQVLSQFVMFEPPSFGSQSTWSMTFPDGRDGSDLEVTWDLENVLSGRLLVRSILGWAVAIWGVAEAMALIREAIA